MITITNQDQVERVEVDKLTDDLYQIYIRTRDKGIEWMQMYDCQKKQFIFGLVYDEQHQLWDSPEKWETVSIDDPLPHHQTFMDYSKEETYVLIVNSALFETRNIVDVFQNS